MSINCPECGYPMKAPSATCFGCGGYLPPLDPAGDVAEPVPEVRIPTSRDDALRALLDG